MYIFIRRFIYLFFLPVMVIIHTGCFQQALGQQYFNTTISQYFSNRYLANPAFAGAHASPYVYGLANRSWTGFDGAPVLVQVSGDMPFSNTAAGGIQLMSDKTGELHRMQAKLSYAYTIPLGGEDEHLKLGISLSGYKEKVDNIMNANGAIDPVAKDLNEKGWRFDGDVGVVYQTQTFFFSATGFNLDQCFRKALSDFPVDLETLSLMTGYTWDMSENISLEPLMGAKFYSRMPWLYKAGAQCSYNKLINVSLLWQNNHSIYGGVGFQLDKIGDIHLYYGSNNKQGYQQSFEIGAGVRL